MTKDEDAAFVASVRELYPRMVDALKSQRKDVGISVLSVLLAEACLYGTDEARALVDFDRVAEATRRHVRTLALRDAPTQGRMN